MLKAQRLALRSVEDALRVARLPPLAWYDVLLELDRAGESGLRPFEIERNMLLAQYNLSRLIDRIEEKGYVERRACTEDGRGQLVVITDAGRIMRRQMWPVYAAAIASAFGDHLSQKQVEVLGNALATLIDKLGAA